MSTAVERTPFDIWESILDSVIDVPGLSTIQIGIPSCTSGNASYWRSERQRGTLRLVCRDWNQWMNRRAHRLLYLRDFFSNEMPIDAIRNARHLIVNVLERQSPCWGGGSYVDVRRRFPDRWTSPIELLIGVASQAKDSRINSLSLLIPGYDLSGSHLLLLSPMFPRLTVLVLESIFAPQSILSIASNFPNLLSLSLTIDDIDNSPVINMESRPSFLKLEFLSIDSTKRYMSKLRFETWRLPSLRILQVRRLSSFTEPVEPLRLIFPSDCHRIKVLSLGFGDGPFQIDHEFWEFFPNIHTFYPHLTSMTIKEPPPVSHPFFSLVFSPTEKEGHLSHKSLGALKDFTTICTGILVVRLAMTWDMFCFRTAFEGSRYPLWTGVITTCRDLRKRLSLADGDGIAYDPKHADMFAENDAIIRKNKSAVDREYHPLKPQDPHRCGWATSSCKKLFAPVVGSEGILLGM